MSATAGTYAAHAVHTAASSYNETNCYTDVLVELLHHRGYEPLAVLGCTLRTDFEGDQFTFFKPADADMEDLLGVDVHEMQPHRPLPDQIAEQLAAGRTLVVELDAFYLPDTASTSYRTAHVKSSVAADAIDRDAEELTYFHNTGRHVLSGADYRGAFRLGAGWSDDVLPPYTELVRFDAGPAPQGDALLLAARERSRSHLTRRPRTDPFARFGARLADDLPTLLAGDAQDFHDYAFATVRMAGSAFEVAAAHVRWLLGEEGEPAAAALMEVVEGSKVLSFRLARRRAFDPAPRIEALGASWTRAMAELVRALG